MDRETATCNGFIWEVKLPGSSPALPTAAGQPEAARVGKMGLESECIPGVIIYWKD